ncbi:MAG: hypothetical protein ACLQVX_24520 [Limisphaerales bacterium]
MNAFLPKSWFPLPLALILIAGLQAAPTGKAAARSSAARPAETPAPQAPSPLRAAVFSAPGLSPESALARQMAALLRGAGYEYESIGVEVITNPARLTVQRYELLVLSDARSLPAASVPAIENYLKAGGGLLALRAPAWESPLLQVQGDWISKETYEKRLSEEKPRHRVETFADATLPGWWRSSNDPQTKAGYRAVQDGAGTALHVTVPQLTSWDTFISPPLRHPFPPDHTLTCFRARGAPHTRQLAVEWDEQDGSRWIAVVNLSPEWKQYALQPQAFKPWESPGRGTPGDGFNPSNAVRFSVGLALSHTALQAREHEYWFAELGTAPNPFGKEEFPSVPRLESLSPGYQFFEITTPVVVRADHQKEPLEQWERNRDGGVLLNQDAPPRPGAAPPARLLLLGLHPRPRGIGFDQDRPFRWEPLLGAYDSLSDDYRGAVAALVVHVAPPFRSGVWAVFTPADESFYLQPLVTNCLRQVLSRMRRGIFLTEGGSDCFTLFEGQRFRAGAEVVNFGKTAATNLTVSVQLADRSGRSQRTVLERALALSPGQTARCDQDALDIQPGEEVVSAVLSSGGRPLDALAHEIGVWKAKSKPEFIRAAQGGLWLGGQPWKAHGVNYMPSTGIGVANLHFFEHWLGRGAYDPALVDRDLRRVKAMNLNAVSIFIDHESLPALNLLDFLRRCETLGLRVNQSLRPGTPMDFHWKEMRELIEFYRMAQNDAIFAYDLAWEPSHGGHDEQERAYSDLWHDWVLARYGGVAAAQRAWTVPAPRNPAQTNRLGVPPMAELLNDGPWRKRVADYRLFLDGQLHQHYAEARRWVTALDPHHAVSFRMSLAGDPTCLSEAVLPYDFYSLVRAVDIWEPEAYGRIGDWERVKAGEFTAAYARLCDPDKPLIWAEMGYSAWDMNPMAPDPDKLAFQAAFYSDFYRMLSESGADGVFFWWYPGGFRLNENSDFGIINPDGTDRPVTRVIRRLGAEFLKAPKPPKPDYWIAVSRERDARGLCGIYAAVGQEFWAAQARGRRPALQWGPAPENSAPSHQETQK